MTDQLRSQLCRHCYLRTLCALLISFLCFIVSSNAMPNPFGTTGKQQEVWTSHSGPTNALWGHEVLVPEEEDLARRKRAAYYPQTSARKIYPGTKQQQRPTYYYPQQQQTANYAPQSPVVYYPQQQQQQATYSVAAGGVPPDTNQQNWITSEHNRYRRMVPATDMRMVYWNQQLAASAQAHANTCDFRHSRNRVNIGENIWAAPYYNYSDAVGRWYDEVSNPWCGCGNGYKGCCGHYIQLVWAQTNLIGCGYAQCNGVVGVGGYARAVFVCHYNPQGNKVMYNPNGQLTAFPAFTWARSETERCSQCPSDQPSCYQGLCYNPGK